MCCWAAWRVASLRALGSSYVNSVLFNFSVLSVLVTILKYICVIAVKNNNNFSLKHVAGYSTMRHKVSIWPPFDQNVCWLYVN